MPSSRAFFMLAVLAALTLVVTCTGCQKAAPEPRQPQAQVIDSKGLLDVLQRDKGTPVVMNFWATWCQPCIDEMPELIKFCRQWAPKKLVFISVSVDDPDTIQERLVPFLKDKNVPFDVYVLKDRSPDAVGKALGVEWQGGVPATFVFDKAGQLRKSWFEGTTGAELETAVKTLQQ